MTLVVVPVRYPLTWNSRATLRRGVEVAREHDGELIVLHVNLYQRDRKTTRTQLKRAVESTISDLPPTRYVVRAGFLLEEAILDELSREDANFVVIGAKQRSRWGRLIDTLVGDPDLEHFLKENLDCTLIVADGS